MEEIEWKDSCGGPKYATLEELIGKLTPAQLCELNKFPKIFKKSDPVEGVGPSGVFCWRDEVESAIGDQDLVNRLYRPYIGAQL